MTFIKFTPSTRDIFCSAYRDVYFLPHAESLNLLLTVSIVGVVVLSAPHYQEASLVPKLAGAAVLLLSVLRYFLWSAYRPCNIRHINHVTTVVCGFCCWAATVSLASHWLKLYLSELLFLGELPELAKSAQNCGETKPLTYSWRQPYE